MALESCKFHIGSKDVAPPQIAVKRSISTLYEGCVATCRSVCYTSRLIRASNIMSAAVLLYIVSIRIQNTKVNVSSTVKRTHSHTAMQSIHTMTVYILIDTLQCSNSMHAAYMWRGSSYIHGYAYEYVMRSMRIAIVAVYISPKAKIKEHKPTFDTRYLLLLSASGHRTTYNAPTAQTKSVSSEFSRR